MALRDDGEFFYGDTPADIRTVLARCSSESYPVDYYADAVCGCGGTAFELALDETEGAAVRTCVECGGQWPLGDSEEYLEDAELGACLCRCGLDVFEITAGVALYEGTMGVRWLYIGCRCVACGLTAVYGDWKNEFEDYRVFLSRI
jgi:hypothetical protein